MQKSIFEPNFEILKRVLMGKKAGRIPLIDHFHDYEIKSAYLGRELFSMEDDIEFYYKAGYDYYGMLVEFDFYGAKWPGKLDKFYIDTAKKLDRASIQKSHTGTYKGCIQNLEDAENHIWPTIQSINFEKIEEAAWKIPSGMKLIPWTRGIFETVNELLGYEHYCYLLYESPEVIEYLYNRVGELKVQLFEVLAGMNKVGALWIGDDIAYTEGLLSSPVFIRKYLFPYYARMGDICRKSGLPFLLHSDGNLNTILDDLLDCGVNAIHPLEPKGMNPVELQKKYGGRLGLLGNIDLDVLARGTRYEVISLVKNNMNVLGNIGGYAIGVSNSVPYYVPIENYIAMVETVKQQ